MKAEKLGIGTREGEPIPVVFGTCRIVNPGIVWLGETKKYRSRSNEPKFHNWCTATLQFVLCRGPIDSIVSVRNEKFTVYGQITGWNATPQAIDKNWVDDNWPGDPPGVLPDPDPEHFKEYGHSPVGLNWYEFGAGNVAPIDGLTIEEQQYAAESYMGVQFGYPQQRPYTNQTNQLPGDDLELNNRRVVSVFLNGFVGFSEQFGSWDFLVHRSKVKLDGTDQWYLEKATIGEGMNPAHMIRECLTNLMNFDETELDEQSFVDAADTLFTENFGLSFLWDAQSEVIEFIREIERHIAAKVYIDRRTGLYTLKLIRRDFEVDDLLVLNESNVISVDDFTRPGYGEIVNSLTVSYNDVTADTKGSTTLTDIALVEQQSYLVSETLEFPGITNASLAARVAEREMRIRSNQLCAATLSVNRAAVALNLSAPFAFSWDAFGISELVMRVAGLSFGDGRSKVVKIQAVQDEYELPTDAFIIQPETEWVDPVQPPVNITLFTVFEVPYLQLVREADQTAVDIELTAYPLRGYAGALASRPQTGATGVAMWSRVGTGAYSQTATLGFASSALLTDAIGFEDVTFAIESGSNLSAIAAGDLVSVGNELMAVVTVSESSLTVLRGALDTIPKQHDADALLLLWPAALLVKDPTARISMQPVNVKLATLTSSQQYDFNTAASDTETMSARANRPYPPANVTLDGEYFPDTLPGEFDIVWSNRNRKTELVPVGWYESDSNAVEAGTTYSFTFRDTLEDEIIHTETAIDPTDLLFAVTDVMTDERPFIEFKMWSVRDGVISSEVLTFTFFNQGAPSLGTTLEFTNPGTQTSPVTLQFT